MKNSYLTLLLGFLFFSVSLYGQEWIVYNANEVPTDFGFSSNSGSANSLVEVIDDPEIPGNKLLFYISPDTDSQYSFTNSLPATVNDLTIAMRVRGIPGIDTLVRLFDLDVRFATVNLREKFIIDYDDDLKFERSGETAELTGAADWHIWRFVCNGSSNDWSLYVDEDDTPLIQSASPDGTSDQYFKMGDGSGGNSMGSLIDWVAWDTTGAYNPIESPLPALSGTTVDKPEIVFLTQRDWVFYDTYGYFADSLHVADLRNQGYTVHMPTYSDYSDVTADEDDLLKKADLVILGRGTSSGDFDDADDVIWSDLKTPVMLMSNFVVRANRLGWMGSNDTQDFARLDTFYANVAAPADPIFSGLSIPPDGVVPYAEDYLGAVLADESMLNGEVLLRLEGVGEAYRIDNANGEITDTFDLADYADNVLMARWTPGDSMYVYSSDLPGFTSVVPNGYRSYVTVGHDREYDTDLATRIRDYYVFTDFSRQAWLNEVEYLINLSSMGNADLQRIEVDGVSIPFDPDNGSIDYAFLPGTNPGHEPVVSALPKAADATVSIAQPGSVDGSAVITVTADDGVTTKTYTLNLSVRTGEGVIVFVTNTDWVEFDTYGPYADSLFVVDLENAGYDVIVTDYSDYSNVDSMETKALEMADLVVLARGTSSGDFDDADDVVWAELETPVVLMSNFVVRANRLGWVRSNDTQDFARLDTYQAEVNTPGDAIFAGVSVPSGGIFPYAEDNLGIVIADESKMTGEVLVRLEGVGEAYRIDNANGEVTDTFDLSDFDENILMARWAPGDSMFVSNMDLPGFNSVVPNGYRSYVTVGHDREYDTNLNTRIRDYYSLTGAGNSLFLHEVGNLIDISEENPNADKYAYLTDLSIDGETLENFNPVKFFYSLQLPAGSPVPATLGVPSYPDAVVTYDLPTALPDTAYVNVASADGSGMLTYSVELTIGTNTHDPKLAGIQVYPNPVRETLFVELPQELTECNISLFSVSGLLLDQLQSNGQVSEINLQDKAPGVYILQIRVADQVYTQKVIRN
ncbi:MAG: T9SS type A sorting domain-containing protein [Bacteroidetes bacterium]|nr:T9SS type A sorting domain-containing protein [Bacteroidota bacterium]